MTTETRIYIWKPIIENLEDKFYIVFVGFDANGFKVTLGRDSSSNTGIIFDFQGAVRSYRVTDDLLSMHLLEGKFIIIDKPAPSTDEKRNTSWAFFKMENSEYLKWASYQSDTVSDCLGIVHYVIWTQDWVIEVLSWGEPTIEYIKL